MKSLDMTASNSILHLPDDALTYENACIPRLQCPTLLTDGNKFLILSLITLTIHVFHAIFQVNGPTGASGLPPSASQGRYAMGVPPRTQGPPRPGYLQKPDQRCVHKSIQHSIKLRKYVCNFPQFDMVIRLFDLFLK